MWIGLKKDYRKRDRTYVRSSLRRPVVPFNHRDIVRAFGGGIT